MNNYAGCCPATEEQAKAHLRQERFQETSCFATKTNFDVTNCLLSGKLCKKKYVFVYEKMNQKLFLDRVNIRSPNICFGCEIACLLEIPIISALQRYAHWICSAKMHVLLALKSWSANCPYCLRKVSVVVGPQKKKKYCHNYHLIIHLTCHKYRSLRYIQIQPK